MTEKERSYIAIDLKSFYASVECVERGVDPFSVTGCGIDLDYCDIEWFALETNRDHSVVFEIASKYCISDSFVDHDGYSISSKGFLLTVVDILVI